MKLRTANHYGYNRRGRTNNSQRIENDSEEDMDSSDDDSEDGSVISVGNRIYFYANVTKYSILALNKKLKRLGAELLFRAIETEMDPLPIFLHINSTGGNATDGLLGMDYIQNCKVPVHTIVDGECCSSATFLSIVGDKRSMHKNSVMLIHQLSTTMWGSFANLEDEMQNCKLIMEKLINIYQKNTKLSLKKIEEILKRDLYFDAEQCLKYGIIDEIV